MEISAIIPLYNGQKFIAEAIDSVISQTLKPKELIIVDDGSTDHSLEIIAKFEAPFPIRVIKQKNSGQSAARNQGVERSHCDFFALLDQDDKWYPQHLEKLAVPFTNNELLGWVYSNFDQTDIKGRVLKKAFLDESGDHPKKDVRRMISTEMMILPATTLIRKKAFLEAGMFDQRLSGYEDDDLFIRMFLAGWDNAFISESLSTWRHHSTSCSHKGMASSRWIFVEKMCELFDKSEDFFFFSASEILGKRFLNTFMQFYLQALNGGQFDKCNFYLGEIINSLKYLPGHSKINWAIKTCVMRYPKLASRLLQIKRKIPILR